MELDHQWADSETISLLESPPDYRAGLEAAGFRVDAIRPRREFAIEFFRQMQARMGADGPPACLTSTAPTARCRRGG